MVGFVFIFVYIYMYMYIYVYVYVCIYVYTNMYIYTEIAWMCWGTLIWGSREGLFGPSDLRYLVSKSLF